VNTLLIALVCSITVLGVLQQLIRIFYDFFSLNLSYRIGSFNTVTDDPVSKIKGALFILLTCTKLYRLG
jgi:hypothetical protein